MGKRVNTAVWVENRNRWQINVQKDGMRKTFISNKPGRTGQREANKKADEWLDNGISSSSIYVKDLYADYIQDILERTSRVYATDEESRGRNYILPVIGNKKISNVTEYDLQNIITKAYKKGLAKKTLQNIRGTIMSFLKFCRKKQVTTLLPEDITVPKRATKEEKQILQPDEIAKLFSVDTTISRNKVVFDETIYAYRLLVATGMRPGELLGLKWEDISDNFIKIRRSINVHGEVSEGKTENAQREIFINDLLSKIISAQKELSITEYVFDRISCHTLYGRWQRYCKSNNITPISLYETRHTFISINKNMPLGQLKPLVGHSAAMDTVKTYGHILNGEEETASIIAGNNLLAIIK